MKMNTNNLPGDAGSYQFESTSRPINSQDGYYENEYQNQMYQSGVNKQESDSYTGYTSTSNQGQW